MFRFFRQIRQRLLAENRFSRYLIYASGEIVLVVVGILIALQIDNWNKQRENRQNELVIIDNLHQEFQANLKTLDSTLALTLSTKQADMQLMALFGEPDSLLKRVNTDSLIYFSTTFYRFVPTQNVLLDLLQSGRLQLISDKALKDALYDWTQTLGQVDEYFEAVRQKTQQEIVPYLTRNYSFKDIDAYSPLAWKEPSRLNGEKLDVFIDRTYENLVDDHLYRIIFYEMYLQETRKIIQRVLDLTAKQS